MCPDTLTVPISARANIPVPIFARVPFRCPYVPEHSSDSDVCWGTILVPICSWTPFQYQHFPVLHFSAHMIPGTFSFLYNTGHHSGAYMFPSTFPVPICSLAPIRCQYVTRNHSGANICPGTLPAPICVWTPFLSLYFPVIHFRAPCVSGHFSGVYMCSVTPKVPIIPRAHFVFVPICAGAPCQCPYVPRHFYVFYM